jgi:hypothetical protein
MTFTQIKAAQPTWSDKTALEAWLKDCGREGVDVQAEFDVTLDDNGEATLTDEDVARLLAIAA